MWIFIHSTKLGESKSEKPEKNGNRNETGIFESDNIIEALNKSRKTVVGGAPKEICKQSYKGFI